MSQEIAEMLLWIERGDLGLWPLVLIKKLESAAPGQALELALRFAESQIARFPVDEPRELMRQDWIRELRTLDKLQTNFADLCQKSRDVWYHQNARDGFQNAISRLFAACADRSRDETVGYLKDIATAVIVLSSDENGAISATAINDFAETYCKLAAELVAT
jgi:hypothetical protein